MMGWQPIETAPSGVAVDTKIDDGMGVRNEAKLIKIGRLWFFLDRSTYAYYPPTLWLHTP